MADIKTHLRELSVAITIGTLIHKEELSSDFYNGKCFFQKAQRFVSNNVASARNICSYDTFPDDLIEIVNNGIKLGKCIFLNKHFVFSEMDRIQWTGNDTQKGDPIDLKVGKYLFSLKEDSFILNNMGLYNLLNCLTGCSYSRGLHVFTTFAKQEYDEWFSYTWQLLVSYLHEHQSWKLKKDCYSSEISLNADTVCLQFNEEKAFLPINLKTNADYMNLTTSHIREKVFSKWINDIASLDKGYIRLKEICSCTAGAALAKIINDNYSPNNLGSFFQLYSFDYYYGKSTASETTVLMVPSVSNFNSIIEFKGCRFEVPSSQLNIYTTFVNKETGKQLQFRNECRFSHGQFNGTPEAKMYVDRKTPLYELYSPI